ncbi:MAG: hypothetical protein EXR69_01035 [Myxococcales bacterium]|nr:hypothetical protein [Myxococcales bacterium]
MTLPGLAPRWLPRGGDRDVLRQLGGGAACAPIADEYQGLMDAEGDDGGGHGVHVYWDDPGGDQ